MNKLPEGWVVRKLGEVCKAVTGTTPPKDDLNNYGLEMPFVKPPQLFDKPINDAPEKLSRKGAALARILPIHSVLVTCIGNLGRTGINNIPVAFNQQINALIPSPNLDGKFLFYQCQSPNFRDQLENLSSATTVAIVNKGKFETIQICFPPLPVQHAIVTKLEEIFSELDHGVAQLKTARQQLKVYRQAVLKWAFEGKLTNEGVVEGELPEGWRWVKLNEICKIVGGVTKGKDFKGKETIHLPYLRVANVQDGYLDLTEIKTIEVLPSDREKYELLYGDILYTEGGDKDKLGRGCIWNKEIENCIHQNHIFRARPLSGETVPKYIAFFSQTKSAKNYFFKHAKQTTNLASINLTILSNLPLPLPPLPEQHRIVSEIERRLSVCDKMEQTIEESLRQAEVLRAGVSKRAFEGGLVASG